VGKRSRKRRSEPAAAPKPAAPARPPRESRSEAKNAAVRAQLEPLAPGERPLAVTIGAIVALVLAAVNLIYYVAGAKIEGGRPALLGILAFTGLMLAMAYGLWRARYWAVLGLEALLGVLIVLLSLVGLLRAENIQSALLVLAILIPAGALFWFNVRAMARIQMPERPQPRR
jgi:hypothetical protein